MKKFLVRILDRQTKKTLTEYEIEALDWYYARHIGIDNYRKEHPEAKDYVADSLEIGGNDNDYQ